ncbi:MAG: hypothetical protein K2O14_02040, partial [Oscillospiraceae bacterium]|nr:hypothetical protein [Oscillospiraceae bacterium]
GHYDLFFLRNHKFTYLKKFSATRPRKLRCAPFSQAPAENFAAWGGSCSRCMSYQLFCGFKAYGIAKIQFFDLPFYDSISYFALFRNRCNRFVTFFPKISLFYINL